LSIVVLKLEEGSMIETRDLRKTYRSRSGPVEAVRGVDLVVKSGEIYGLLGPNGAGKTTTMRMLATLIPPTSGAATVAGVDLLARPREVRRRIGYVAQGGSTDREMAAHRELYQQGRFHGLSRTQARTRTDETIGALRLAEIADRPVKTYSGGQARRLDIAIGLVHRPALLFLDEPTTGLDPQSRAYLWDEVRKLRDDGTTIFLTTHYLDEADALCDRVAIVDHGLVVADGPPAALKRDIAGESIVIGSEAPLGVRDALAGLSGLRDLTLGENEVRAYVDDAAGALPAALRLLDSAGESVTTASVSRPSLDDVFMQKTGRSLREVAA
jgi:ABC-2 type transport system ATP-binding protein